MNSDYIWWTLAVLILLLFFVPWKEIRDKKVEVTPIVVDPVVTPTPLTTTPATPVKKVETEKVEVKSGGGFGGVLVGILTFALLVVSAIAFFSGKTTEVVREVARSGQIAVGMEAIGHEICMVESGCQHFKDGKVNIHINEDGSEDVGKYQFHRPTWEKEIADNNLGLKLESEADQEKLFRYAVLKYGYGPWVKSLHKWGVNIHESIWLKVFVRPNEWTDEYLLPAVGGGTSPESNGKRFKIRARGEKGVAETSFPGPPGEETKIGKIFGFQLMSLEDEPIAITLFVIPKS